MKLFQILKIIFFVIFLCSNLLAESVSVTITPEKSKIYLGDKVKFTILINSKEKILNISDNITKKLKNFEISKIEKDLSKNTAKFSFFIQFFQTGNIEIPEIDFLLKTSNDKFIIYTNKLKLNILSNLTPNTKFQPIKPPMKVKFYLTSTELMLLIIILIIIAIIIFIIYKFKKKNLEKRDIVKIELSPYDEFLKGVEYCNKLLKEEKIREFYFSISHITRHFIDRKFNLKTLEATLKEIENLFQKDNSINNDFKEQIIMLFKKWEYYKFTGNFPEKDEAYKDLEKIKEIMKNV